MIQVCAKAVISPETGPPTSPPSGTFPVSDSAPPSANGSAGKLPDVYLRGGAGLTPPDGPHDFANNAGRKTRPDKGGMSMNRVTA